MSSPKTIEKVIILSDLSLGLCCRVHSFMSARRPQNSIVSAANPQAPVTAESERFMKALITKRHPELPPDITKLTGYEAFRKNSSAVVASFNDYYKTLCDAVS